VQGKKAKAAQMLGIDSSTLYRKLERYKMLDKTTDSDQTDSQ
jgi:DNA-binding protein Fis